MAPILNLQSRWGKSFRGEKVFIRLNCSHWVTWASTEKARRSLDLETSLLSLTLNLEYGRPTYGVPHLWQRSTLLSPDINDWGSLPLEIWTAGCAGMWSSTRARIWSTSLLTCKTSASSLMVDVSHYHGTVWLNPGWMTLQSGGPVLKKTVNPEYWSVPLPGGKSLAPRVYRIPPQANRHMQWSRDWAFLSHSVRMLQQSGEKLL